MRNVPLERLFLLTLAFNEQRRDSAEGKLKMDSRAKEIRRNP